MRGVWFGERGTPRWMGDGTIFDMLSHGLATFFSKPKGIHFYEEGNVLIF